MKNITQNKKRDRDVERMGCGRGRSLSQHIILESAINIAKGDTNKASLSESSSAKQTRRVLASAPPAPEARFSLVPFF
jgi:hypothetical protein